MLRIGKTDDPALLFRYPVGVMSTQPTEEERNNLLVILELAREEDLGTGDLTGRLLPAALRAEARFIARERIVLAGGAFLDEIARAYNDQIRTLLLVDEGSWVEPGECLAEWHGPGWAVLAAERVALNFLQRLCGIATLTRRYVEAIGDAPGKVYDTRKTTPGWRNLEKYAVRVGGGGNHRRGLYDAVLVKDNHLAALAKAGRNSPLEDIGHELQSLRSNLRHDGFVEVEVDTLEQYSKALQLPVDVILLDNMTPDQIRQAVIMRNDAGLEGSIQLEASGNISLDDVAEYASAGVERLAVGALTHSARSVDIGLDIEVNL